MVAVREHEIITTDEASSISLPEEPGRPAQEATDRLLDYMIANNIAPTVQIQGNVSDACVNALLKFKSLLPEYLHDDLYALFEFLFEWIACYAAKKNIQSLDLSIALERVGS